MFSYIITVLQKEMIGVHLCLHGNDGHITNDDFSKNLSTENHPQMLSDYYFGDTARSDANSNCFVNVSM